MTAGTAAPPLPNAHVPTVCAALAEVLGLATHQVGPDVQLGTLVTDSLGVLLLTAWLEEHGVRAPDLDAVGTWTPRDVARLGFGAERSSVGAQTMRDRCRAFTSLRPLHAAEQWELTDLALGDATPTWLAGPGGPADRDALGGLLARALTHRVVTPAKAPQTMIGHAVAYDADPRSGVAKLALALRAPNEWAGGGAAACLLFADELFRGWPLRKLVLETPAPTAATYLDELEVWCTLEGRLHDHVWQDGAHHDLLLWACTRQQCADVLSHPPATLLARRSSWLRRSGIAPVSDQAIDHEPQERP